MNRRNAHPAVADPQQRLAEAVAHALAAQLQPIGENQWRGTVADQAPAPAESPAQTVAEVLLRFTGAVEGVLRLSLVAASADALLIATPGGPYHAVPEAWSALLQGALPSVAEGVSRAVGETSLAEAGAADPGGFQPTFAELTLQADADAALTIALAADTTLHRNLELLRSEPAAREVASSVSGEATHIDRVIDVPLAVTLRFGQRRLTLREVLALSTGSLVELDRQVEEPVELVLGDRLIARGEVVIVEGNYGLRVTEVYEGAAQRVRHAVEGATRGVVTA